MPQIRVFVVDDSALYRKTLIEIINTIPNVRTVGVAENGEEAIEAICRSKPDFITLDLYMPRMDGYETVLKLKEVYPEFRAIMISTYTTKGEKATIECLQAGALDFITKPDENDEALNYTKLREQLVAMFEKYFPLGEGFRDESPLEFSQNKSIQKGSSQNRVYSVTPSVIAIGLSTGGPDALATLLPALPQDFSVPILIVQHMPEHFTKTLAESLNNKSRITVVEAANGMIVNRGMVYIAPGGYQMKVEKNDNGTVVIQITEDPPEKQCKPSADYLFRSIATVYGEESLGVVMTGIGSDGTDGLAQMKKGGATIIGQDRSSCTVYGMPSAAKSAGVVDIELPLSQIALELIKATKATL